MEILSDGAFLILSKLNWPFCKNTDFDVIIGSMNSILGFPWISSPSVLFLPFFHCSVILDMKPTLMTSVI